MVLKDHIRLLRLVLGTRDLSWPREIRGSFWFSNGINIYKKPLSDDQVALLSPSKWD